MKRYASDPPSPGARHRRLALGVRHTNRRASSGRPTLIRVLVADAHPVVRAGLRAILAVHHDIAVLGEASTGAEACVLAATKPWDMVVLDMGLPDRNALDVLKDIKRHRPRLPILILSAYPEQGLAMRAFRAGATGYITKMAAPDELMSAVRRLAQGRRYMSAGVADELIGALGHDDSDAPHERLSDRQYQILCLLGSGKSIGQIAGELRRSIKTISTHRTRILEKIGMENNAQLIHYVLQRHLAEPA